MNNEEFENNIKNAVYANATPHRTHFKSTLSMLGENVTKSATMRYRDAVYKLQKNIINNVQYVVESIRIKRIVLVPSLILVLVIGGFSISSQTTNANKTLERLAEENETIEEPGIDLDDSIILTSFDAPAVNDLSNNQNEINL